MGRAGSGDGRGAGRGVLALRSEGSGVRDQGSGFKDLGPETRGSGQMCAHYFLCSFTAWRL
ncbi:hypothetical protein SBA5_1010021 [Candidatus Sulfotelmatomonas gaucii]|uniref:Uncharacterized protein n=1 Tax=Candidatus Sulfuritelmatomonas gaucii TaxID=2043161 RepID=A0A2N9L2M1_9BACT|nr:hypothetical protein SBA5_1010021 [Candidatus Sulfotelmatomonas gaucii]